MAHIEDLKLEEEKMDELVESEGLFQPLPEQPELMEDVVEIQETGVPAVTTTISGQPSSDDPYIGSYTLRVENLSTALDSKIYSEKFEVGTYFWRLLVFPKGNVISKQLDHLSVYLDAPEAPYTPQHLSPRASFKLILVNQLDPANSFSKDTQHTFTTNETDWGFTSFVALSDLFDPAKGYVVDDMMELRVEIQVQKDERWSYDSRKETGCVGLKNQGATCYMNSLLQYMFHLPFFRKAVYHMPISETDEPSKSIPLALQSLFYKLQYSKTSVSTKDLTKSFGWTTYDSFMQHDVQELNRVLCEKLEEKMKGTRVDKVINQLFEGHTYNFVECMNVEYKSTRKESFMDLQLDVKGCKDVYDSFDRYTEVETLEGANQYNAEGHGMQDARKGVLFESFPPVLQLQLKRFEYDFQRDTMIKINDRYEFPDELDLDVGDRKYLAPDSDPSVVNKYKLHSVLVHSGGVHGGHYYAFIRHNGTNWLRFDDDRVSQEEPKNALDEQFGGEDENPPTAPGFAQQPSFKFTKYSNAYMLVYVRVSDWDNILCDVTKIDIAEHLRTRLEAEQAEKERRQKEKAEAHLYCTLKIARDEDLLKQIGKTRHFDLVEHEGVLSFRLKKQTKFIDFKRQVESELGVPVAQQRYWTWSRRQNNTFRPTRVLREDEEALSLMDLRDHRETSSQHLNKGALMDLKLFLETPQALPTSPPQTQLHKMGKNEIFLFFKLYDPDKEQLSYVGRMFAPKQAKIQDLYPYMCRMAGLPESTPLEAYEEIKFEPSVMCDRLEGRSILGASSSQLEDGDIVCFQRAVPPEEEPTLRHPHVKQYLQYIRDRKVVNFRKLEEPKEEGFTLELLRDMNYQEVTQKLAEHLMLEDPSKLRLSQHNAYSHQPQRNPMKYKVLNRLEAMLQHGNHTNDILYYEVLDMPLPELEQLKTLKVAFHNEKSEQVGQEHVIRLPRDSTVEDVLHLLRKALGPDYANKQFRLIEVFNSRVYKICDAGDNVDTINDSYWNLRAEVAPEEEQELQEGEQLIHVYHFTVDKDSSNLVKDAANITNFGDPFFLRIGEHETLASLKPRIQAKLGISDEEFAKWRFAFCSIRNSPEYLNDEDTLASRFIKASTTLRGNENNFLGLEHEDKSPRRTNHLRYNYERPVKIYN